MNRSIKAEIRGQFAGHCIASTDALVPFLDGTEWIPGRRPTDGGLTVNQSHF